MYIKDIARLLPRYERLFIFFCSVKDYKYLNITWNGNMFGIGDTE